MATRTLTKQDAFVDNSIYSWTGLLNGDDGSVLGATFAGDRCVQVTGTFGTGGTAIVEGSLDGTNWFQLRDPTSTLISLTAAGVKAILEATPYVRPRITAGDGTTSLTVLISARRA